MSSEHIIPRKYALQVLQSALPGDSALCLATVEYEGRRMRLVRSDDCGQAPTLLSVEGIADVKPDFFWAVVRDGDFTLIDSATDG